MTSWISIAVSMAAFLAAAKAHGRQIRLERELAGIFEVVFGGKNSPFVTTLWRRDRIILWTTAVAVLALFVAYVSVRHRARWEYLPLSFLWPITSGFFTAGLTGLVRTVSAYRKSAPQHNAGFPPAFSGSLGWWLLATILLKASIVLFFLCRNN